MMSICLPPSFFGLVAKCFQQLTVIFQYAIRAREMWSRAGPENRNRVDILSRIEEDGKKNPDAALSSQEIIAEMMEIL